MAAKKPTKKVTKTLAKKTVAKKTVAKKTVAKKVVAKKAVAKKAVAAKSPAKKAVTKKAGAVVAAKDMGPKAVAAKKLETRKVAAEVFPTAPRKRARSYLGGEVTLEELRALTAQFSEASPLFSDDRMSRTVYDVLLVDGDLHVHGDLETWKQKLGGLVITGSLTVDGLYADSDDPVCGVFVLGDMTAKRVVTTGALGVGGTLTVTESLIGFYNDYSACIGGDVVTTLFHPENHYFDIGGQLLAAHVVGHGAELRVPKRLLKRAISLRPADLREVLVEEVIDGGEGVGEEELDDETLRRRVREGRQVLLA